MVCLGFEPGAAGWKVRTNPLSYGGTPRDMFFNPHSHPNGFFRGSPMLMDPTPANSQSQFRISYYAATVATM